MPKTQVENSHCDKIDTNQQQKNKLLLKSLCRFKNQPKIGVKDRG